MSNTQSPEPAITTSAGAKPPAGKIRWIVCFLLFFATTTNYVDRAILSVLFPILKDSPTGVALVDPQQGATVPPVTSAPPGAAAPSLSTAPAIGAKPGDWWAKLPEGAAVVDSQGDTKIVKHVTPGLGWNDDDYGNINAVFSLAYGIGLFFAGGFIKRVGIRWGLFWAVLAWTIASRAHGLVAFIDPYAHTTVFGETYLSTVVAFCVCRVFLAITEAANFPAAIKAVAEWFPKKERALSTGLFNSGANVGAMIAPFVVPFIAVAWGWSVAFYITGVLAVIWLIMWVMLYRSPEHHPTLTKEELAYIKSDVDEQEPERRVPWRTFFFRRQTIAFSLGKFLTDPIWWFYLFWVPSFLNQRFHVKVTEVGLPLVFIYTMTTFGSIGGGWLSSFLIRIGWSVNAARKTAMLVCALCVVPVFCAALIPTTWGTSGLWLAIVLIALAASAHQGFSANIFTLVSDTVPKQGVPAVTGIGGMAGAIGGMFLAKIVGLILFHTHSYLYPLFIASSAYLIAILIIHLILPRLQRMQLPAAIGLPGQADPDA